MVFLLNNAAITVSKCEKKASMMAQLVKNLPAMQETQEIWVQSLGREDLLEEEMATTPVFWPGESHGEKSLVGYHLWGHKESDTAECLSTAQT